MRGSRCFSTVPHASGGLSRLESGGSMSASVPTPLMTPRAEPLRTRGIALHREVLLATDGWPAAAAASRVAAALAARWEVRPHACTVLPPPSVAFDPVTMAVACGPSVEDEIRGEVSRQLDACTPGSLGWSREMT